MNVLTLFGDVSPKKQPPDTILDLIVRTELALTTLFRDIAAEKNQMLNAVIIHGTHPAYYQAAIIRSAHHLVQQLKNLAAKQTDDKHTLAAADLTGNITALNRAIEIFEENEQAVAQLLLICSSIKLHVEKILVTE
jgi:hypothetical protein